MVAKFTIMIIRVAEIYCFGIYLRRFIIGAAILAILLPMTVLPVNEIIFVS